MKTITGEATLYPPGRQPKPKLILEFKTREDREAWLAAYYNSGEQEMFEAFNTIGNQYPEVTITEED